MLCRRIALRSHVHPFARTASRPFSQSIRRPRQYPEQHHTHRPQHQHQYITPKHTSPQSQYDALQSAKPLVPDSLANRFQNAGSGYTSKASVAVIMVAAIAFYFYNSQKVPVTGRRRFNFLSDAWVAASHKRDADMVIEEVTREGGRFLSEWDPMTIAVKTVMQRLIPLSGLEHLDWEIHVIDDPKIANAFVLPGGKVFVHSGILNICRTDDALAAVLGHEVAHNTASHAAERLSTYWVGMLTGGSLFFLAGAAPGLALFGIWSFVGGFYLQDLLFNLPMGRQQESEADYIGLMMMAEACYDPRAAMGFWQRMEKMAQQGGQEVPEMLSTHPSNEHRIAKIAQWMPEAVKKREQSECRVTTAFADKFRQTLRGPLM